MSATLDTTRLASELRIVLGHLVRRLRSERSFPLSHAAVLGRLDREGTKSIGDLALAERVRPQSMTQTISDMESDGLISRRADPNDGRRSLVELTDEGREALEADRRQRDGWLARSIEEDLTGEEQLVLERALALLRRVAGD